jgi:nucleoside-diphosphate-sugar epimerase
LVAEGHGVTGTSRTAARAASVDAAGGHGVVCDALDRDAVFAAVAAAAPEVVVHQLTAMPEKYTKLRTGSEATSRLRREGTRHLVDGAVAAGARRVIAQSIAFLYEPSGPAVATEESPVWTAAADSSGGLLGATFDLERTVLDADGIEGVVLRYGALYGPGTYYAPDGDVTRMIRKRQWPIVADGGALTSFVHADDAVAATVLALSGPAGVYNVTDDAPVPARDWVPAVAALAGAKPPRRLPRWLVRTAVGSTAATMLTQQRGASNAKAKAELGWTLRHPVWQDGFRAEFG